MQQGYQTFSLREKQPYAIYQGVGRKASKNPKRLQALVPNLEAGDRRCGRCRRPHAVGDTLVSPTTPRVSKVCQAAPREHRKPCKGFQARAWPPQRSAAADPSLRETQSEGRKGTLDWVEHRENLNPKRSGG